jgi:1-acyl-sn-glycerol-3-phosphate acyltransferase
VLTFLTGFARGFLGITAFIVNTIFWAVPIYIVSLFKLTIPFKMVRIACDTLINKLSYTWMYCNNLFIDLLKKVEYNVQGIEELEIDQWYLVMANHQSWVDIIVLQKIFHNRIPFVKYFLKRELIWVPILGLAWWAMDYPFMKRYSAEFIKKNPHLKGKDLEMTRRYCEKFKDKPTSIINFVEGTRFTSEKKEIQKSPYRYLLKPKSGGISFVLSAMGEYIQKIIDVTIVYPDGAESLWRFLCSSRTRIHVHINVFPIDPGLIGDYFNDEAFRDNFQIWMNNLWSKKDMRIEEILLQSKCGNGSVPMHEI